MINLELEELNDAIDEAMDALLPRQRLFVVELVTGRTETATDAMLRIGTRNRQPKQAAYKMQQLPRVAHAIKLLRHRQELHEGVYIGRKRQHLLDIVHETKTTKPAVAVSAIKTLNEMDGDIAPKQVQLDANITQVVYQLETGRVIDANPAEIEGDAYTEHTQSDDDFLS